jgi:hypothetical protein
MRGVLCEQGCEFVVACSLVLMAGNPGEGDGGLGGGLRSSSGVMLSVFGVFCCPDVSSEPGDALVVFVLHVMVTIA